MRTLSWWTITTNSYQNKTVGFSYPKSNSYNWNYLDHLIAGYEDQIYESLKFWRARFILLPGDINNIPLGFLNENTQYLSEEEIRLSGFSKFLEQFQKICINLEHNNFKNN